MEEIHDMQSPLSNLKRNPFSCNGDYFQSFPNQLKNRIVSQRPASMAERIYFFLKPQLIVVSTMVAIYAVVFFSFSTYRDIHLTRNSLSREIQQMKEMEASGIDEAVLIDYMVSEAGNQTAQEVKSDEIIDYLVSSGIEYEAIADEL